MGRGDIIGKVEAFMERFHMAAKGDTVIVGVSGGADSVCLLRILKNLHEKLGFALRAVHVEHGIRGEASTGDAAFVRELCKRLDISFAQYAYNVPEIARERGQSEEEAGRELRYEAFLKEAGKYAHAKIAVAHHQNDSAETMLYHLIRGSRIAGLGGIAPVRGQIIRPLLCLQREEIESYLRKIGQDYRVDETNLRNVYARNRLRNEVFPILRELNPAAVSHMAQTAETMREMRQYLSESAARLQNDVTESRSEGVMIRTDALEKEPQLLCFEVLYQVIAKLAGSRKDIEEIHVRNVWELAKKQVGKSVSLPYGFLAKRIYGGVWIGRAPKVEEDRTWGTFSWRLFEKTLEIRGFPKKKYTKWFDYDKIKDGLCVRGRREGDYFYLKEDGSVKKLKRYFTDEKIPSEQRDRIPLLADGSHIVWIVGYRVSAHYKITDHTRRILEVQYETPSV